MFTYIDIEFMNVNNLYRVKFNDSDVNFHTCWAINSHCQSEFGTCIFFREHSFKARVSLFIILKVSMSSI